LIIRIFSILAMSFADFQRFLHDTADPNDEIRNNAVTQLESFQEENIEAYLQFLGAAVFDHSSPPLQAQAIVRLFGHVRGIPYFSSPPVVEQFWSPFLAQLPDLISAEVLADHVRLIVMDTIGGLGTRLAARDDHSISTLLLQFYEAHPQLEPLILHGMVAMLAESQSLCGIPPESILHILSSPGPAGSVSDIRRFALYFAAARICQDSIAFHELFQPILASISIDDLSKAVNILTDFCDTCPLFLQDHIDVLLRWVCAVITTADSRARCPAMMILDVLVTRVPWMCARMPFFGPIVCDCMLTVMSEVDDTTPLLRSESDDSPVIRARDCLETVWRYVENDSIIAHMATVWGILEEPDANWNLTYAILSALSVMSRRRVGDFAIDPVALQIAECVWGIGTARAAPVVIRVAALNAFRRVLACVLGQLVGGAPDRFAGMVIDVLRGESEPVLQFCLVRCLVPIVSELRGLAHREVLGRVTEYIIGVLVNGCPVEIARKLIGVLGTVLAVVDASDAMAMAIAPALLEFAGPAHARGTRIRALLAFSRYFLHGREQYEEELLDVVDVFLGLAWELAGGAAGDDEVADCHAVLLSCFRAIGVRRLPYAKQVLERMREIVAEPIDMRDYVEFSGESLKLSFMERIECEGGARQYVEKAVIHRIQNALQMMAVFLDRPSTSVSDDASGTLVPDDALAPLVEDATLALEFVVGRLRSESYIPSIDGHLWALLSVLISFPGVSADIVELPLRLFLEIDRPHRPVTSFRALFGCLHAAIVLSPVRGEDEQRALLERAIEVFFRGTNEIRTVVDRLRPGDGIDEEGDTVGELIRAVEYFESVLVIMLANYPAVAVPYVAGHLIPEVMGWLEVPAMRRVAVCVLAAYAGETGDLGQLATLAEFMNMMINTEGDPDMKEQVFHVFHSLFESHTVPPEVFQQFFDLLCRYLDGPEALKREFGMASDEATLALTWLLKTNFAMYVDDGLLYLWAEYLPLEVKHPEWEGPASLFADWAERRDIDTWNFEDFEHFLPWFVSHRMLTMCSEETAGRLLQWLHRLLEYHRGSRPNLVQDALRGLVNACALLTPIIGRVLQAAQAQPLDGPCIPVRLLF
jgi:hypothetical protein